MERLTEHLRVKLHRIRHAGERAASLVEYALLVALIAVVMIGAVTFFGEATDGSLRNSNEQIQTAIDGGSG